MKNTGLALLLLFFLSPSVLSQEVFWIGKDGGRLESEILLKQYRDGIWERLDFPPADSFELNFHPALAVSPSGELWAVWAAPDTGVETKIFFSRRRSGIWTEPRRLTASDDFWEMTPVIAFGPDGTLLAAWSGARGGVSVIYCSRWEEGGFGPAEPVSSPVSSPALNPALAVAAGGRALLAWQGWKEKYYRVFASYLDGGKWSPEKTISRVGEIDQIRPSVMSLTGVGWDCSWAEKGKLRSAVFDIRGEKEPAAVGASSEKVLAVAGEPPSAGWLVERIHDGTTRTRRTGIIFEQVGDSSGPREETAVSDREYIGYGDSITMIAPPDTYSYIPHLRSMLPSAYGGSYTIHDRGYGGAGTDALLTGGVVIGGVYVPGINAVLDSLPGASRILIMAGTNNRWGDYSLVKHELGAMIDRARERGREPVLATIIPSVLFLDWARVLNNDYIIPLAGEKECILANPYQAFLSYGNWPRDLMLPSPPDNNLHPNDAGAGVIADAWFLALSNARPAGELEWYLPAGGTKDFDTYILVSNPNREEAVVEIEYIGPNGSFDSFTHSLAPSSRYTANIKNLPLVGNNREAVGTIVRSTNGVGVIAERAMYWPKGAGPEGWTGGHNTIGLSTTGVSWFLAEGATHIFDQFVHVLNPDDGSVDVEVMFFNQSSDFWKETSLLGSRSVWTVRVSDVEGADNQDQLSAWVRSSRPVAVDRTMYWPKGDKWKDGHASIGVTEGVKEWYLPEGATHIFDQYVLVANPSSKTAEVVFFFRDQHGNPWYHPTDIDPQHRRTVKVNNVVGSVEQVSTRITSNVPVVAERTMYWQPNTQPSWTGGHGTVGVPAPAPSWQFPEGATNLFDKYVLVSNPSASQAKVWFTFMGAGGEIGSHYAVVEPGRRYTVKVNNVVGPVEQVSTRISSSVPLVAERAMYWPPGNWRAGHSSIGYAK